MQHEETNSAHELPSTLTAQEKARWARHWFAGAPYCPRGTQDESITTVGSDSNHAGTIETWHCGACGHHWKIELSEAAALADTNDGRAQWIERIDTASIGAVAEWLETATKFPIFINGEHSNEYVLEKVTALRAASGLSSRALAARQKHRSRIT